MIGRRGFITGLISLVAAPAIVRVASIMPVKVMEFDFTTYGRYVIKLDPIDIERWIKPPYLIVSPAFKKAFDAQMGRTSMPMIVTQDIPTA